MARPEYCRFLVGKWRSRTLGMTLEQEGLLIRISAFNMDAGVAMPACRTTAARMLGCHRNKLNKLLDALIQLGEVAEDETGIYSPRALSEYTRATRELNRRQPVEKPEPSPEHTPEIPQRYPEDTPPVEAEKAKQILRARRGEESREEKITTTLPSQTEAARADAPRWKVVADACMEAIGDAADPLAIGLVSVAEPLGWIAQGADLDLDILPAIRALAAAQLQRGQRISSWNYFAGRVSKNRANRDAGLPVAEPDKPTRRKLTRYQGLVEVSP